MQRNVCLLVVLVSAIAFPVKGAGLPQYYGFEESEQFTVGVLNGQRGWTTEENKLDDSVIVFDVLQGAELAIAANGAFDGSFHLGAASPIFDTTGIPVVTTTQELRLDRSMESDYLVQTVDSSDDTSGIAVVQLQFTCNERLIVNGVLTDYQWKPGAQMVIAIEHDLAAGTASVLIDNAPVTIQLDIGHVNCITQLQYAMDDYLFEDASTMFVDNISIVPEPSAVGMAALMSILCAYRRGCTFAMWQRRSH